MITNFYEFATNSPFLAFFLTIFVVDALVRLIVGVVQATNRS